MLDVLGWGPAVLPGVIPVDGGDLQERRLPSIHAWERNYGYIPRPARPPLTVFKDHPGEAGALFRHRELIDGQLTEVRPVVHRNKFGGIPATSPRTVLMLVRVLPRTAASLRGGPGTIEGFVFSWRHLLPGFVSVLGLGRPTLRRAPWTGVRGLQSHRLRAAWSRVVPPAGSAPFMPTRRAAGPGPAGPRAQLMRPGADGISDWLSPERRIGSRCHPVR